MENLGSGGARLDNRTSTNRKAREARMAELLTIIQDPTTSDNDKGRATLELIRLEKKNK